ncbi:MAG TPA: hypothetical protein VHZ51_29055 [Ktedonobacteraceae bacterium]|nr:hypothetical protein [Ktedonobacteraceae bacterium]
MNPLAFYLLYGTSYLFVKKTLTFDAAYAAGMMLKMRYTAHSEERKKVDGLTGAFSPALTLAQGVPRRG